ncbi:unnamed protein product [Musa acuminata var. zebrina]
MSCPTCNVEIREEQVRSRCAIYSQHAAVGFACRDRRGAEEEEEERTSTRAREAHTLRGELGRALHMVGRRAAMIRKQSAICVALAVTQLGPSIHVK